MRVSIPCLPSFPFPVSLRNESRVSQAVAWTLTIIASLLILVIIAFVGVLLAGNSLVSRGVEQGGGAVRALLPEVVQVRNDSLREVTDRVLGEYQELLEDIYQRVG